ncbi:hypothetical protein F5Y12DRAFT_735099 [Xylaria sp. FL1777]|nr:hypothetical protein F5Y12DRAFT_735099 [Xylaria sp. FL1777]
MFLTMVEFAQILSTHAAGAARAIILNVSNRYLSNASKTVYTVLEYSINSPIAAATRGAITRTHVGRLWFGVCRVFDNDGFSVEK